MATKFITMLQIKKLNPRVALKLLRKETKTRANLNLMTNISVTVNNSCFEYDVL